ncbi:hypothetical protein IE81DRAFT_101160 [Ceraceosorus guamensis]|uniref:AMP-dependent synthetase/ligase domain-containing protein n=1 Tax=Ceraceosorus guamensis TaxID=1522189 RepID=A0A316VM63_9BASI|nr:hypothetical protein IE81DRAFT_101160 [Ceraceosorus guamensis]PWN38656.1 hypothetical protein IE81DRAFT_101160 [Ceraceosorus guamensis]
MTAASASSSSTNIHTSPHPPLHLPRVTLPTFLFAPLHSTSTSAFTTPSSPRLNKPILHPPPSESTVSTRSRATPLSLAQVRDQAYALAAGLLDDKVAQSFGLKEGLSKGDTVALFSANQVSP